MIVTNAKSQRPVRRPLSLRACAIGVALGLYAATAGALPVSTATVTMGQSATGAMADPAKRLPGAVTVSAIDFKRGDGGSGKLILRFSGEGAAPDLRNMGSSVVVDIGNAQLPASLQRPINVTDFATPVQRIDARATSNGAQLVLNTKGTFESMAYQSGNEYIVEVVPRAAPVATKARAGAPAMGAASMGATSSTSDVHYSGKAVTFNFQDVPVRTVLQLIAEESNLNIVAADTVQGNVTLRLINVPWDQALDIVLQAKSLDKRRSGNVVWVAPQKEIAQFEQDKEDARINLEQRAEKVTEYIPVNYANAEDIANLLTEGAKGSQQGGGQGGGGANGGQLDRGFLSQRGSISFDKRTNTLLVIDIPERVANIHDLVNKLDKPVDQVVIEARIVIANESVARELGARFGISGSANSGKGYFSNSIENNILTQNSLANANNLNNNSTTPPNPPILPSITRGLMSNLPATLQNPAGSLALSILNAGYALDMELSAIQEQGRAEVISNPRIVTSSQKEAVIRQGKEIGYLTVTGGQSGSIPTVQFKEALLELKVTPTITNDGRVFLNLAIKKDELDGFISVGAFGQVPQIAKREVNTAVLIEDGQTVVIGGVYEFSDRTDIAKVPFLGDIPFIGNLFRNKNRTKTKAELLIFVTPKVMRVAQRN
ncbi:type IV pilus secretin PilQ family protein [Thermomonas sp.]|uniref:type IV pilus secretin PilQ n=1 Tax=Thermomonas sp. TaxID=1971895 RepID=UPI0024872173|nr:type IV pilus secretin PilQ family protein [Thermomonas sp.]MDI1251753.1 type IV pilus secretin PilQ family protein [Thermomonas sp.]